MNSVKMEMTKWQKFYIIVAIIVAISASVSFTIDKFFLAEKEDDFNVIDLWLPDSDADHNIENSVKAFVSIFNQQQSSSDNKVRLNFIYQEDRVKYVDDFGKNNNKLIGLIVLDAELPTTLKDKINNKNIPIVSNLTSNEKAIVLNYDTNNAVNFMVSYAKSIISQQDMCIISDDSDDAKEKIKIISDAYRNDKEVNIKVISLPNDEISNEEISYLKDYFNSIDYASVYLAVDENKSSKLIPIIKNSSSVIDIFTPSYFALDKIKNKFGQNSPEMLNGIYTETPILYDTSSATAQKFYHYFVMETGKKPDWLSAFSYAACEIITQVNNQESSYNTIMGNFNKNNKNLDLSVKIGRYTGDTMISTPIQLTPIESKNIDNYVFAISDKRAILVNNKFMYKTNVVYTGMALNNISEINFDKETAKVNFSIWFRYRGDFDPKDIVFENAIEPILLSKPTNEIKKDDIVYKEYTASGVFRMNFNEARKNYNKNNIEVIFRHKKLNTNNLIFVTDFLGMPSANELAQQPAQQASLISDNSEWKVESSTLSQEIIMSPTKGAPNYVEYQGEKPLFSQIVLSSTIGSSAVNINEYVDSDYFIHIFVLGFIGLFFAIMMDLKRWGKYWSLQAWILRLFSLPLILIVIGNIVIDNVFTYTDLSTTLLFIQIYHSLWYILPAYLLISSIDRFIWVPLEQKAGKKIPGIARLFVSFIIYLIAVSSIVSFVFNESITSFLAASGVLATVVGLAIHEKISDVFSGIILNIEKPFSVGDKIRFKDGDEPVKGVVLDIGWRGTVISRKDGITIIIKNSDMLNIVVENISRTKIFNYVEFVPVSINKKTEDIIHIIEQCLSNNPLIVVQPNTNNADDEDKRNVVVHKILKNETGWICEYKLSFSTYHYADKAKVMEYVWRELLKENHHHGLIFES